MGKFLNRFGIIVIIASFIIGVLSGPFIFVTLPTILILGILCIGLGRAIDLLEEIKKKKY